jgi:putative transposase
MPIRPSADHTGPTYHVVNRAVFGQLLYQNFGEYLAYVRLMAWALDSSPIELFAFCLMPNHVHLLLRTPAEREMSAFMHRLTMTHALRLRGWRGTRGRGAVYQSRFRASLVAKDSYFYRAVRYVERNPVRANFVQRVEDWMWSSASPVAMLQGVKLAPWPLPQPRDWRAYVNEVEPQPDLDFMRLRVQRREPFADATAEMEVPAHRDEKPVAVPDDD